MSEDRNRENQHWESKAWFRFSKVIYYLTVCIALFVVSLLAYSVRPTSNTYTDGSKTVIKCDNGHVIRNKRRYLTDYSGLSYSDDIELKNLCKFGESNLVTALERQKKGDLPDERNYSLEFFKTTNNYGSWKQVLTVLLVGIPIVIVTFEIIKRVFLYVTIGKNPFKIK